MARFFSKSPRDKSAFRLVAFAVVCLLLSFFIAWGALDFWHAVAFAIARDGWKWTEQDKTLYLVSLVFANLALFGTIIFAIFTLFDASIRRHLIRLFAARHSVICGLGWQGRGFAYHLKDNPFRTVGIEIAASEDSASFCKKNLVVLYHGNADHRSELLAAAVHRADRIFVCTGNQDENLHIAHEIHDLISHHEDHWLIKLATQGWLQLRRAWWTLGSADERQKEKAPVRLYISVSAKNIDHGLGGGVLADFFPASEKIEPILYNADILSARMFFYHHRPHEWAQLWGQRRVHLVFVGLSRIGAELILQYARIWPYAKFKKPLITIISRHPEDIEKLRQRYPALFDSQHGCCELNAVNREDPSSNLIDEPIMIDTSNKAPITAVIICHEDSTINLDRAINIRHLSNKINRWRVPLFVHTPRQEGMDAVFGTSANNSNPAQRIVPFGSAREHCDVKLIDYMDRLARQMHNDYLQQPGIHDANAHLLPANRRWHALPLKLRVPNQRAADHAMVKLADAGYRWHGYKPSLPNARRLKEKKRLARTEHQSWCNERRLAGYRAGSQRDEARLIHNTLLPWDELAEKDKNKDRDQIDSIATCLWPDSAGTHPAYHRLRIAIVGDRFITPVQSQTLINDFHRLYRGRLRRLCEHRFSEIITTLKPAAEMEITRALLETFRQVPAINRSGGPLIDMSPPEPEHRLLTLKDDSSDHADDAFKTHWERGNAWTDYGLYQPPSNDIRWQHFNRLMNDDRGNICALAAQCEMLDLSMPGAGSDPQTTAATPVAEHWIAKRANVLIALTRKRAGAGEPPADARVAETIKQWQRTHPKHPDRLFEIQV